MNVVLDDVGGCFLASNMPRVDVYYGVHKALRALMADTLIAVGRLDTGDNIEVLHTSRRVMELLNFCRSHLAREQDFIHKAMEARAPGASELIAHEHKSHLADMDILSKMVDALLAGAIKPSDELERSERRRLVGLDLYRKLSLFIADNFQHMHIEETAHNAVLWARYTDAELRALHEQLTASISADEMMYAIRWLVPHMNPRERASAISELHMRLPATMFAAVLEVIRTHLSTGVWEKLVRDMLPIAVTSQDFQEVVTPMFPLIPGAAERQA